MTWCPRCGEPVTAGQPWAICPTTGQPVMEYIDPYLPPGWMAFLKEEVLVTAIRMLPGGGVQYRYGKAGG